MSEEFGAVALKSFRWRGRQVKPGDVIPAAELAATSGPVVRALISTGDISRDHLALAAPDERIASLEARVAELTAQVAALRGERAAA